MKNWKFFTLILSCVLILSACSKENDPLLPEDKPKPDKPNQEHPAKVNEVDVTKNILGTNCEFIPVDENNGILKFYGDAVDILDLADNKTIEMPVKIVVGEDKTYAYLLNDGFYNDNLKVTFYSKSTLFTKSDNPETKLNLSVFYVLKNGFDVNSSPEPGVTEKTSFKLESDNYVNLNGKSLKLKDIYNAIFDVRSFSFQIYRYKEEDHGYEEKGGDPLDFYWVSQWEYEFTPNGDKRLFSINELFPLIFHKCNMFDSGGMYIHVNGDVSAHCFSSTAVSLSFIAQDSSTAKILTRSKPWDETDLPVSLLTGGDYSSQCIFLDDFLPIEIFLNNINILFTKIDNSNRDVRVYAWLGNGGKTYCTFHPGISLSKLLVTSALNEYFNNSQVKGNLAKGLAQNKSLGISETEALKLLGNLTTYVNADPNFKVSITMEYTYDTTSAKSIQEIKELMQLAK